MTRGLRLAVALGVFIFAFGVLCGGMLLIISEGDPIRYVRTTFLRLQLAGREADLDRAMSEDTTPVRFRINPGDTPRIIAANLVASGLIADADLFVDFVRVEGIDTRLEAGTYFLSRAETLREIAFALTDSRSGQFAFRILEGWRLEEIAAVIDQNPYFGFSGQDFLNAAGPGSQVDPAFSAYVGLPSGASLEGYMFPNTYTLPAEITPQSLVSFLTAEFTSQVTPDLAAAAAQQGLTLHQVVTLASIVQREAVHPQEQPLIASVYRNRLAIGMKLDADPTVQYAIGWRDGRWWPQITQADYVSVVSPYNTYLNTGFPPGPIASPGLSAIRAVIYPEPSRYLFFQAECTGSGYHVFAYTYEEHLGNSCR
ncbi:MAG: endolytic transglycosylase MltG [Anaerolinea sp.]|nr:endolytic transglycosylase MltG [Anaerolinea sp.]